MIRAILVAATMTFIISSCKKDTAAPPDNPNIHIDAFLLKQADNNFLFTTDTLGVVHDDTITITLPGGGNPTILQMIPTISFTGDSISPSSGTVQDFTRPLTYTVYGPVNTKKKYVVQVVFTSRNELLVNTSRLFALDLGTGVVRWIAEHDWNVNFVTSSSIVANDTVYTCVGSGYLYAAKAVDGTKLWSQYIGNGLLSSPVIANGKLYTGCGDGSMYAINSHSGATIWSKKLDQYGVFTTPTISNGILYFQCNQKIYALDGGTGNTIWTSPVNASFYASVTMGNDLLYASGADSNFYALDIQTGNIAWSFYLGANGTSPALANGTLYEAAYNDSLFAIDAMTGTKKWSVYVNQGPSNPYVSYPGIQSNPVVHDNTVVTGGGDPNLYAFDIATGNLIWMAALDNIVKAGIVCVDGILYPDTGSIYSIDAGTGKIKWMQGIGSNLTPTIISMSGAVYNARN
jgi:eukaryotic-like serine/threonine-protein kinase